MDATVVMFTTVLGAFAMVATAIYALAGRLGGQLGRLDHRVDALAGSLGSRIDRLDHRVDAMTDSLGGRIDRWGVRIDGLDAKVTGVHEELTVVRAALAGLDSRVATIEQRLS